MKCGILLAPMVVGLMSMVAWAQSLVGLRIDGSGQVDENTVTFYRVMAEFDNGQEYEVTLSSYLWVSPEQYAEIGLFGDFATYEVPAVAVETIWAYYAFGADVETASLDVTIENIFNVLDVWPAPDSVLVAAPENIVITLSEAADESTVNTSTCRLVRSVDGVFGNGDDEQITPANVDLTDPTHIAIDLTGVELPDDLYRVSLGGSVAGNALQFDGSDDRVFVPRHISLEPPDALTVEVWFFATEEGPRLSRLLRKAGHFQPGYAISWDHLNNRRVSFGLDPLVVSDPTHHSAYLDSWHHAAGTFAAGDRIRLYIDGQFVGEELGAPASAMHTADLYFASGLPSTDPSEFWQGTLDEVRIWNVTRSEDEIRRDMHHTLTGNEPGLVGYWNFDEGSGQVAHDLSPFGNDGQLGKNGDPGGDSGDPQWVASTAPIYGISDLDGNVLDGEFSGSFPSGDGTAGGDFVYQFTIARIPGDFDEDGDVDLDDYEMFENCLSLSGPGVTPPFTECLDVFDFDADDDCDLADYTIFTANFTGPL